MKINKILSTISGVMLLLAIPSIWPYGYFQLLRWVVSITGISNAYQTYKTKENGWMITMILVVILFNPIAPLTFSKGIWTLLDMICAFIMFIISLEFRDRENKNN